MESFHAMIFFLFSDIDIQKNMYIDKVDRRQVENKNVDLFDRLKWSSAEIIKSSAVRASGRLSTRVILLNLKCSVFAYWS